MQIDNSSPVGKRLSMIGYTMKNICKIEVYEKHIKEECKRVRSLVGEKNSPYSTNPCSDAEIWEEDSITNIPGASGKKGSNID